MDIKEFLRTVVTAPEGFFSLCVRASEWKELWYKWPDDLDNIVIDALENCLSSDVYFSSYLFSRQCSLKECVLPSRTIQADLDEADISRLNLIPTVMVESSPGRHQGYWLLDEFSPVHEELSRKLTYSISGCDHSGWALGRKLRIPFTLNYKYPIPTPVSITQVTGKIYSVTEVDLLPTVERVEPDGYLEWIENPKSDGMPLELLASVKSQIPPKVYSNYKIVTTDRSAYLWSLMCALFRVGFTREQVFTVAKATVNNKFRDLRYNSERELAKDVARAQAEVQFQPVDIRKIILDIRKTSGLGAQKKQQIASLALKSLSESGKFCHTEDDNVWYLQSSTGRPIAIARNSEYLQMILENTFGLNRTEPECSYTTANLLSHTFSLPMHTRTASLTYYDDKTNKLYLHTGRRDVIVISESDIRVIANGEENVLFPWLPSNEPFSPDYSSDLNWIEELFGGCFENCLSHSKDEGSIILYVWLLFLFLRNDAISRPILALFGSPGSGKSTMFRRIYALLFGKQKSLSSVTNQEAFDHSTSTDPLVVLDNVDSYERWLPDRLALAAATSDITKRRLYTDVDSITIKRQALLGITAHNPRFGREDVADRLLILFFQRLSSFLPEGDIINAILRNRNQLWGCIIKDIQKVLQQPNPSSVEVPQFRIEDFARIGLRIARSVGKESIFIDSIRKTVETQQDFMLDEEQILVSALLNMCAKYSSSNFKTANELWSQLELVASDAQAFQRAYKNSAFLGRKLWTLQESLKKVFNVEWRIERGSRTWNIQKRSS